MYKLKFLMLIFVFTAPVTSHSQTLAFPSAEGFGRYASGGRGGIIYRVTNLNDDGEGSLRKGIVKHGPRIIVFDVSGTIDLESDLDVNRADLTILGQTAPGDGITLRGYPFTIKANNVIVRYLRFRMGDIKEVEGDALGCRGTKNVIIDHCSISWATDENGSFYNNEDFTLQWCIISEALNNSIHHKGSHGYGGIWGGVNASFHHNLLACNNSRNPRFSGSETTENSRNEFVDFRNNVIYNWGENSIYGGENGTYNIVDNYFKSGPATTSSKLNRIVSPSKPYGKFYVSNNFVYGYPEISENNWNGGVQCESPEDTRIHQAIDISSNVEKTSAIESYVQVLNFAGASKFRDQVDERIVSNVRHGTASYKDGIIDSQNEVGGWPKMKSPIKIKDFDQDGIPDEWEKAHGLNSEIDDAALSSLDDDYSNIEVYSHSILEKCNN